MNDNFAAKTATPTEISEIPAKTATPTEISEIPAKTATTAMPMYRRRLAGPSPRPPRLPNRTDFRIPAKTATENEIPAKTAMPLASSGNLRFLRVAPVLRQNRQPVPPQTLDSGRIGNRFADFRQKRQPFLRAPLHESSCLFVFFVVKVLVFRQNRQPIVVLPLGQESTPFDTPRTLCDNQP